MLVPHSVRLGPSSTACVVGAVGLSSPALQQAGFISFGAGMTAADHNHIKGFRVQHD